MSRIPLYPIAASPSLSLALFRLAHTPTARLAINYILRPRRLPLVPTRPYERSLGAALTLGRSLGTALEVDRYVTGGIIGTQLAILDRPLYFPVPVRRPDNALGTAIDVVA